MPVNKGFKTVGIIHCVSCCVAEKRKKSLGQTLTYLHQGIRSLFCEDCSGGSVGKGVTGGHELGKGVTGEAVVGDVVRASTHVPFSTSQWHGCLMHCFFDVALSQTNCVGWKDGNWLGIVVSVGIVDDVGCVDGLTRKGIANTVVSFHTNPPSPPPPFTMTSPPDVKL